MMKATLEFDLPDEKFEHSCATRSTDLFSCLSEIDELLRSLIKYGGIDDISAEKLAEEIRSEISDVICWIE